MPAIQDSIVFYLNLKNIELGVSWILTKHIPNIRNFIRISYCLLFKLKIIHQNHSNLMILCAFNNHLYTNGGHLGFFIM